MIACLVAAAVYGQAPPAADDLSVEEILRTQITSVGRKAQQVAKAPAAVYVITQEDIRRSGATNIPDLLRIVPGLVVARINGSTWAISARGDARQYSQKMLVLPFTEVFRGEDREVLGLEEELKRELKGIARWALEGARGEAPRPAPARAGSSPATGTDPLAAPCGATRIRCGCMR